MTRDNEQYAYFTLVGDFDPSVISERLGILPTDCWKKGDRNERTHLERKFSRWSLYSRLERAQPLESQLNDVLEQLLPIADAVRTIREEIEGHVALVSYLYRDYPGLTFEPVALAHLGAMKLAIDLDFYYLYSDKREDS